MARRSETSGRVDDNWQSILKRFTVFEKVTGAGVGAYRNAMKMMAILVEMTDVKATMAAARRDAHAGIAACHPPVQGGW